MALPRIIPAILLLLGQLFWLGAPAVCPAQGNHSAPAHEEHSAPPAPGATGCAMLVACSAPAQLPVAGTTLPIEPFDHRLIAAEVPGLRAAEPTGPLPPPPQA